MRNLAFEATKTDVQELFASFGSVKSVRLPRKQDGSHRGFAFVEFLTHAEADSAKASLASSHLYGRHLVIEWAAAEKDKTGAADADVAAAVPAPSASKPAAAARGAARKGGDGDGLRGTPSGKGGVSAAAPSPSSGPAAAASPRTFVPDPSLRGHALVAAAAAAGVKAKRMSFA